MSLDVNSKENVVGPFIPSLWDFGVDQIPIPQRIVAAALHINREGKREVLINNSYIGSVCIDFDWCCCESIYIYITHICKDGYLPFYTGHRKAL
jgi:hypothetical protein